VAQTYPVTELVVSAPAGQPHPLGVFQESLERFHPAPEGARTARQEPAATSLREVKLVSEVRLGKAECLAQAARAAPMRRQTWVAPTGSAVRPVREEHPPVVAQSVLALAVLTVRAVLHSIESPKRILAQNSSMASLTPPNRS
jgi:hypothetical protein